MRKNIIYGILIKEAQDIKQNANILMMCILPIILTFAGRYFISEESNLTALIIGLSFLVIMIGMYIPSIIISEEKGKNTMEILLLSPATPTEVLVGKGLITFLAILFTSIILVFIGNIDLVQANSIISLLIITTVISIFSICVGMIIGIISPNQMSTGPIGMIAYIFFHLVPIIIINMGLTKNIIIRVLSSIIPTLYFLQALEKIENNLGMRDIIYETGIMVISVIVIFFILLKIYKKRGLN